MILGGGLGYYLWQGQSQPVQFNAEDFAAHSSQAAPVVSAPPDAGELVPMWQPSQRIVIIDGKARRVSSEDIQEINKQLGTGFTPILDAEIADLVDSDGRFGIAPEKRRYPQENIQFANMPDRLHIWRRDLPYDLPQLVATSAEGLDVTDSISAFLEGGAGTGFWLHGSGREISLRSTQLEPGDYKLRLSAQDRYGNCNKLYTIVVVYD